MESKRVFFVAHVQKSQVQIDVQEKNWCAPWKFHKYSPWKLAESPKKARVFFQALFWGAMLTSSRVISVILSSDKGESYCSSMLLLRD